VVYLQLHVPGVFSMGHMTPSSRMTPTCMGGVHTNLAVSPSFKIKKLILTLGSHRFFTMWPWTYHVWTMNSRMFKFLTDGANCKGMFGSQSPNEMVNGLKSPKQWICRE